MNVIWVRNLLVLAGLLLCGAPKSVWANPQTGAEQAQALEQKAFELIEAEDWCAATNAFLDAYEKAPIIEHLFNAAKAARLAGDRRQAMQLNIDLLGKFPGTSLINEVNQNNKELSDEMAQKGPGTTCPRQNIALSEKSPQKNEPASSPASTSEMETGGPVAPAPELPPAPEESASGMNGLTIGALAGGGVLTLAGGWALYWGLSSYFRGLEIANDPEYSQEEYETHHQNFVSRDFPIQLAGWGALACGLTGLGLGTWWLVSENPE